MLGLKKKTVDVKSITRRFVFEKFGLYQADKGALCAVESINCRCTDGVLRTGIGGKPFVSAQGVTVTDSVLSNPYRMVSLQIYGTDNLTTEEINFVISDTGYVLKYNYEKKKFESKFFSGRRAKILYLYSKDNKSFYLTAGGARITKVNTALTESDPIFTNSYPLLCQVHNRIFICIGVNELMYSDPSTPWTFTSSIDNGGKILLRSGFEKPVDLIGTEDSVYVFYKRKILRVKVCGNASEFEVDEIAYSGEEVVNYSACVLNGKVYFLATDGVHRIDKKNTVKLCEHIPLSPASETAECIWATFDGKCVWEFFDTEGTQKAFVFDGKSESGYYMTPVKALGPGKKTALFWANKMTYQLCEDGDLPDGAEYLFKTDALNFGLRGLKCLKSVEFEGVGSFTLGVDSGNGYREYTLTFETGLAKAKIGERAENFAFTLKLHKGASIRKMTAEVVSLT